MEHQLLAVLEVDETQRVKCQAPGCGKSVYRRIHVLRTANGSFHVYGSDCYHQLFEGKAKNQRPRYHASEARRLTDEERALLVTNTELLIERFEAEYQQAESLRVVSNATGVQTDHKSQLVHQVRADPRQTVPSDSDDLLQLAKARVRDKYKVDPDLPGWTGLVQQELRQLRAKALG